MIRARILILSGRYIDEKMGEVLQPGVQIRPILNIKEATLLAEKLFNIKVESIKELDAYDDKNYHIKVIQDASSSSSWPHGYILKILNSMDSKKADYVDAQNQMMLWLTKKGIRCTKPIKSVRGHLYQEEEINGSRHIVRLLDYQPGEILYNVPVDPELCVQSGRYLAEINTALEDFSHPAYQHHSTIWALNSVPKLVEFLYPIKDQSQKQLTAQIIDAFTEHVVPLINELPKGMIHGDFNEHNILVRQTSGRWVSDGILDFGDTQYNCYLFEVALAACYMMLQAKEALEPVRAGALVVAGYNKIRPLSCMELMLMRVCICARLSQSLVLGIYSHSLDPTNEYVLQTAKSGSGWKILESTWNMSDEEYFEKLTMEIEKQK